MEHISYCPICKKNGITSKLKLYPISFEESAWLCENESCMYPINYGIPQYSNSSESNPIPPKYTNTKTKYDVVIDILSGGYCSDYLYVLQFFHHNIKDTRLNIADVFDGLDSTQKDKFRHIYTNYIDNRTSNWYGRYCEKKSYEIKSNIVKLLPCNAVTEIIEYMFEYKHCSDTFDVCLSCQDLINLKTVECHANQLLKKKATLSTEQFNEILLNLVELCDLHELKYDAILRFDHDETMKLYLELDDCSKHFSILSIKKTWNENKSPSTESKSCMQDYNSNIETISQHVSSTSLRDDERKNNNCEIKKTDTSNTVDTCVITKLSELKKDALHVETYLSSHEESFNMPIINLSSEESKDLKVVRVNNSYKTEDRFTLNQNSDRNITNSQRNCKTSNDLLLCTANIHNSKTEVEKSETCKQDYDSNIETISQHVSSISLRDIKRKNNNCEIKKTDTSNTVDTCVITKLSELKKDVLHVETYSSSHEESFNMPIINWSSEESKDLNVVRVNNSYKTKDRSTLNQNGDQNITNSQRNCKSSNNLLLCTANIHNSKTEVEKSETSKQDYDSNVESIPQHMPSAFLRNIESKKNNCEVSETDISKIVDTSVITKLSELKKDLHVEACSISHEESFNMPIINWSSEESKNLEVVKVNNSYKTEDKSTLNQNSDQNITNSQGNCQISNNLLLCNSTANVHNSTTVVETADLLVETLSSSCEEAFNMPIINLCSEKSTKIKTCKQDYDSNIESIPQHMSSAFLRNIESKKNNSEVSETDTFKTVYTCAITKLSALKKNLHVETCSISHEESFNMPITNLSSEESKDLKDVRVNNSCKTEDKPILNQNSDQNITNSQGNCQISHNLWLCNSTASVHNSTTEVETADLLVETLSSSCEESFNMPIINLCSEKSTKSKTCKQDYDRNIESIPQNMPSAFLRNIESKKNYCEVSDTSKIVDTSVTTKLSELNKDLHVETCSISHEESFNMPIINLSSEESKDLKVVRVNNSCKTEDKSTLNQNSDQNITNSQGNCQISNNLLLCNSTANVHNSTTEVETADLLVETFSSSREESFNIPIINFSSKKSTKSKTCKQDYDSNIDTIPQHGSSTLLIDIESKNKTCERYKTDTSKTVDTCVITKLSELKKDVLHVESCSSSHEESFNMPIINLSSEESKDMKVSQVNNLYKTEDQSSLNENSNKIITNSQEKIPVGNNLLLCNTSGNICNATPEINNTTKILTSEFLDSLPMFFVEDSYVHHPVKNVSILTNNKDMRKETVVPHKREAPDTVRNTKIEILENRLIKAKDKCATQIKKIDSTSARKGFIRTQSGSQFKIISKNFNRNIPQQNIDITNLVSNQIDLIKKSEDINGVNIGGACKNELVGALPTNKINGNNSCDWKKIYPPNIPLEKGDKFIAMSPTQQHVTSIEKAQLSAPTKKEIGVTTSTSDINRPFEDIVMLTPDCCKVAESIAEKQNNAPMEITVSVGDDSSQTIKLLVAAVTESVSTHTFQETKQNSINTHSFNEHHVKKARNIIGSVKDNTNKSKLNISSKGAIPKTNVKAVKKSKCSFLYESEESDDGILASPKKNVSKPSRRFKVRGRKNRETKIDDIAALIELNLLSD